RDCTFAGQPGTFGKNSTQRALSGHTEPRLLPVQFRTVQKPPGSDVSHTRVPSLAQSVDRAQLSPMSGVHPVSHAEPARATRANDAAGSQCLGTGSRIVALVYPSEP